jgi:spermidine synthase
MAGRRNAASALLPFVFFCSGGIALVYEVLWQRQFALLFGSGAPATAVVLAAYFSGLGVGSFVFGRWGGQLSRPLNWYAGLEFVIALGALLVLPVLSLYEKWYPEIVQNFGGAPAQLLCAKGLLALAAILIPTAAMGATLPVLAELVDPHKKQLGLRVGWLYVVNTAGAAAGAACVPYVLLPQLGMSKTVLACAAGNIVIGLLALWMRTRWPSTAAIAMPKVRVRVPGRWLGLAFVSGAGIFALQVLWNRAFAQVHENSIYSFAVVVTIFIVAIALGGQAARWILRKGIEVDRALGTTWVIGGIAVAFCPALFVAWTNGLAYFRGEWMSLVLRGGSLVLLPAALLAAGLPLLIEKLGHLSKKSAVEVMGNILALNITGSIAGALLAGFALPAWLGMWNAMVAVGAMFAVAGASMLWKSAAPRAVLVLALVAFAWVHQRADLPRTRLDEKRGEQLLALKESGYGIVAVTGRADSRRLKLNNNYTLGGTSATGDERMQAHIPLLIHPRPQRAVFLGFGTGITAGGALFHPGISVQAVELVPEVSALAAKYFAEANENFQAHSSARLIIDDARNFLRGTHDKFDVMVNDIVVPWQQGEGALYTREHFVAAKRALNTNGVFCVWIPAFQLGQTEFNILLRTFLSVFGRAQVWRGDFSPSRPALALIACERPLNQADIERRLGEMKADPANPHLRSARAFWMHFIGILNDEDIAEPRINSEDRPWIELFAPRQENFLTGRRLQLWQSAMGGHLEGDAEVGRAAGHMMLEFTVATSESNRQRAQQIQGRLREMLGAETFQLVFGVP